MYTSISTEVDGAVRSFLRKSAVIRRARDLFRQSPSQLGVRGFHGDRILRDLILRLTKVLPITAFVETGTNEGETCGFVAKSRPALPVYSCEIHPPSFELSRTRLAPFPNVEVRKESSPDFLRGLMAEKKFGDLPLFWLDAHWFDYWPLNDELKIITAPGGRAIILIDDFEIPSRPQFGYDVEEIGGEKRNCNFDFIASSLTQSNHYAMLLPTYQRNAAFPWGKGSLRGYPVIFMNCPDALAATDHSFMKKNFASVPVNLHSD